MKILVTGALGNVGGYVIKHALLNGQEIKAADINKDLLVKKFGSDIQSVYFDFTKPETFKEALTGVDRVFVMRPPHLGVPEDLKPFIEAMKESGNIKMVSFLSLIGVEKNTRPPHHKIEKFIEAAGLPFCHIRPNFFMQNISGIHAFEIKYFDRIVVPIKNALTGFIDAEDIGELISTVFSNCTKHLNTALSITGSEAIDYYTVEKILSDELGRKIVYTNPKPKFAKEYWINVRGMDKEQATVMHWLYFMTRMGTSNVITDTFRNVVGREPTTFAEFVKKNKSA